MQISLSLPLISLMREAQRCYIRADRCRRTTRKIGRGDVDERNRDNEISTEKQAFQQEERVQDHLEDDNNRQSETFAIDN